eukprot:10917261-Alexandrium_andersonii.AAC.1
MGDLRTVLNSAWLLRAGDRVHIAAPRRIEAALGEAWSETRLAVRWNGLITGHGEPWCSGPGSA